MSVLVPGNASLVSTGPGGIFGAPLGTELPTWVSTGSSFAGVTLPTGWFPYGYTDSGFQRSTSFEQEGVAVEEEDEDIRTITTKVTNTFSFTLAQDSLRTLKAMYNGLTVETTGTGATQVRKATPPLLGGQNASMFLWRSDNGRIVEIFYSALQTGSPTPERRKGAAKTVYALEFTVQKPDPAVSTATWARYVAGVGDEV